MKKFISLITVIIACCMFCITASATSIFHVTAEGLGYMRDAETKAREAAELDASASYVVVDLGNNSVYFNGAVFDEYTTKEQKEWIIAFTEELQNNAEMYVSDKQAIFTNMKEMDNNYVQSQVAYLLNESSGSIHEATLLLKPVLNVVSLVLGVAALIMTLGILLMTVVDLACLGIPFFSVKADGTKPKFMSADAFKAMKESQDEDTSVYLLYFKRRIITYVVLIVCIIFLVTGNLGGLFIGITDLFSGITGVI